MKVLTILAAVAVLAVTGCRTQRIEVIRSVDAPKQQLSEREKSAIRAAIGARPDIIPQPPLTMDAKFAAICPYCNEVNLCNWAGSSGGSTVVVGQPIAIRIGAFVTNIISEVNGNLEQWTISYTCRNCEMGYSTARDQLVPIYTSVRLPIRE